MKTFDDLKRELAELKAVQESLREIRSLVAQGDYDKYLSNYAAVSGYLIGIGVGLEDDIVEAEENERLG